MQTFRSLLKSLPLLKKISRDINNQYSRDDFVIAELNKIPADHLLLDAGCGSQRYREHASHLRYQTQDFGKYKSDLKKTINDLSGADDGQYQYGPIDYVSNIWDVPAPNCAFHAILCTEVFEHIPYPIETVKEFSRLLKKDGKLILTAPSNCLRHMDPYFYYSGFSDRWYEKVLTENGFEIESINPVGDYYQWIAVEIARTLTKSTYLGKILLAPAFFYYYYVRKTEISTNTLCMGYHVVAKKI